jgi:hypothetical protein
MFRRIRSAIPRESDVIPMKLLYVCYVMKAELFVKQYRSVSFQQFQSGVLVSVR